MPPFEPKENSGVLFINDRKQTENQPDRKGTARIGGVDMWISGWVKKDKNGNPFMSLSFTPKDQAPKPTDAHWLAGKAVSSESKKYPEPHTPIDESDIPF